MSLGDRDYMRDSRLNGNAKPKGRRARGPSKPGLLGTILRWLVWIAIFSLAYYFWFR